MVEMEVNGRDSVYESLTRSNYEKLVDIHIMIASMIPVTCGAPLYTWLPWMAVVTLCVH